MPEPETYTKPHQRKERHGEKSRLRLLCSKGVAPALEAEVRALGFPILQNDHSGVTVLGTFNDCMRLNLELRTAQRVLYEILSFRAEDPDTLYSKLSTIAWEELISPEENLCVTSFADNPTIRDSRFANLKVKDAIVDRIKARVGRRPDSGPERARAAVVHLFWKGSNAIVYIDTSGEPLYKRGYRAKGVEAPLQETLGAAIVMLSRWRGEGRLVNPMCGSGTLAIEAALSGLDAAPGMLRENFGFRHISLFSKTRWREERKRASMKTKAELPFKILASDIDARAVRAARENARLAGVDSFIEFTTGDFNSIAVPPPVSGQRNVLVMNPEYGQRLGAKQNLETVYKSIGDFLKNKCKGYTGYVLSGDSALTKSIGLRTSSKTELYNGPIECRLLEYELYEGSKKQKNK